MISQQLQKIECDRWAKEGEEFSLELYSYNIDVYNKLKSRYSYLSIANAIALTWTKHAVFDPNFIELASAYFDGKEKFTNQDAIKYMQRFGADSLLISAQGLKEFSDTISAKVPDFKSCSAKEIKKFQNSSFNKLSSMKKNGKAVGVGPWLFLGPMKIILGLEKRLWSSNEIDAVTLPSGIEVARGVRKIVKSGYPVAQTFDAGYLKNEEQSLEEGYTIDTLIHNLFNDIAKISKTRVIHINSAFYLLGTNE